MPPVFCWICGREALLTHGAALPSDSKRPARTWYEHLEWTRNFRALKLNSQRTHLKALELRLVPTHPLLAAAPSWHSDLVSAVRNFAPLLRRRTRSYSRCHWANWARGRTWRASGQGQREKLFGASVRPTVFVRRRPPPRNIGCGLSDEDGRAADGDEGRTEGILRIPPG